MTTDKTAPSTSSGLSFDVLILGGGMVGASLAVALAPLGLRLAVVEAYSPRKSHQPSYDDRATAVSLGSQRIFATMGLWPSLAGSATAIRRVHVSERGRFGATRIDSDEEGVPALGYVIENRVLGAQLWRRLETADNITMLCPATPEKIVVDDARVCVTVNANGRRQDVTAALVVGADGSQSASREMAGIAATETPYGQTGVIANVTTQKAHGNTAWERFTDTGPLAFLPMRNGRSSVVWTLDPERAASVMALDDNGFLNALQRSFGYRLGRLVKTGQRYAYPLSMVRAASIVANRVALVGNAAHGLHPVAGQGFNLGLRDVAALADVVADGCATASADGTPQDCGADVLLRRYEAWRADDQSNVVTLTDALVKVFTNPFEPLRMARGVGLLALDALPMARREFARRTMGLHGPMPRLARGIPLTR